MAAYAFPMLRQGRLVLPAFLLLLVLSPACSSSSSQGAASTACTSNSDCNSGLSCIGLATYNDAGCTESGKACSKTCTSDSDCASLGTGFKCVAGCPGSPMFCAGTQ